MQVGLILDLVLVGLVVLVAFVSAQKGFLLLILDIAASVAAFITARVACAPVAQYVYTNYLQDKVLLKATEYMSNGAESVNGIADTINEVLTGISPALDGLVKNFGIFPVITGEQTALTSQSIETTYLAPAITGLLTAVSMVLIAVLSLIVLRIVAQVLNHLIVRKPLKKINKTLGWILGVIKGLIPVFIVACVLVMAAPIFEVEKINELVDTSYMCKLASFVLEKISL